MAISIKAPEADRLARELAAVTGETITEAVIVAMRSRIRIHCLRRFEPSVTTVLPCPSWTHGPTMRFSDTMKMGFLHDCGHLRAARNSVRRARGTTP